MNTWGWNSFDEIGWNETDTVGLGVEIIVRLKTVYVSGRAFLSRKCFGFAMASRIINGSAFLTKFVKGDT